MPHRGRDTHDLEMHIAFSSLTMAGMCVHYHDRFATFVLNQGVLFSTPVWAWAALWLISAGMLAHGIFRHSWREIEYGSLLTMALWTVVFFGALTSHLMYPLSAAVAPPFIVFSLRVYVYRVRLSRIQRDGRYPSDGGTARH